jgi:transposase
LFRGFKQKPKKRDRRLPLLNYQDIGFVGEWEGYRVATIQRRLWGWRRRVVITLEEEPGYIGVCDGCGGEVQAVHERVYREVRDLPILDAETVVVLQRRRLECPKCGPTLERLEWLERYERLTNRLADAVARLCEVLPIKQVASFYGLGWETVKEIHKSWLQKSLGPVDLSGLRVIGMDEFAIQKGHRYATVVVDPLRRRVLWVGRGRGRKDVRPFFQLLGPEGCAKLEAVAMDMSAAYEEEVRQRCPKAEIVWDLFHVVAKYGREVIDRTRVDEANRLRQDPKGRKVVKGARWLLLRNKKNLRKTEDRVRLQELLAANEQLAAVYVLKDDLKHLWDYKYPGAARRFWQQWYDRAKESGIEPLIKFAKALEGRLEGILAHCRYPLHTSVIEGINNKIKVIKRMAYGFRDDEYFFLRIRAAFPGIP